MLVLASGTRPSGALVNWKLVLEIRSCLMALFWNCTFTLASWTPETLVQPSGRVITRVTVSELLIRLARSRLERRMDWMGSMTDASPEMRMVAGSMSMVTSSTVAPPPSITGISSGTSLNMDTGSVT